MASRNTSTTVCAELLSLAWMPVIKCEKPSIKPWNTIFHRISPAINIAVKK
jgi:hypothetical protein